MTEEESEETQEAQAVEGSTIDPLKKSVSKDDSGEISSLSGTYKLNEDGTEWKPPAEDEEEV